MRGSHIAGRLFTLVALLSWMIPVSLLSQSATADQYYAAGSKLYAAKNYAQAAKYYYAAVKLNPNHAASYQALGNCYYSLGDKKNALAFYQRASALQPANAQLAQFVRSLASQVGAGAAATAPGTAQGGQADQYYAAGNKLYAAKNYAQAARYYYAAVKLNPSHAASYQGLGNCYYALDRKKDSLAFYQRASSLQPSNTQLAQFVQNLSAQVGGGIGVGSVTPATTTPAVAAGPQKSDLTFGFHLMGGVEYVLSDPAGIIDKAKGAGSVSLTGVTPSFTAFPEFQPYVRIGDNFEVNLTVGYFPVGLLSYTTYDFFRPNEALTGGPDMWKYTFNTTIITADLGGKIYFGGKDVKGYLGLSGGISPISMKVSKATYDYDDDYDNAIGPPTSANPVSNPDGIIDNDRMFTEIDQLDFTTMAFSAQAILGADFSMGKDFSVGPYVGYRYLSASNFKNGANTLVVDKNTGAVGYVGQHNVDANPANSEPLTLDFSGIVGGVNVTFSF